MIDASNVQPGPDDLCYFVTSQIGVHEKHEVHEQTIHMSCELSVGYVCGGEPTQNSSWNNLGQSWTFWAGQVVGAERETMVSDAQPAAIGSSH